MSISVTHGEETFEIGVAVLVNEIRPASFSFSFAEGSKGYGVSRVSLG